jgi:hypothetical protein
MGELCRNAIVSSDIDQRELKDMPIETERDRVTDKSAPVVNQIVQKNEAEGQCFLKSEEKISYADSRELFLKLLNASSQRFYSRVLYYISGQ